MKPSKSTKKRKSNWNSEEKWKELKISRKSETKEEKTRNHTHTYADTCIFINICLLRIFSLYICLYRLIIN